jgi:hypothetical protein
MMIAMACTVDAAQACPPGERRCDQVNIVLQKLGYRDSILEGQQQCELGAKGMDPETIANRNSIVYAGIKPGVAGWAELVEAHSQFAVEACGGEEVVQLVLESYRQEWLKRLDDDQLKRASEGQMEAARSMLPEVNRVARSRVGHILAAMERRAEQRYIAAMDAVAMGRASASSEEREAAGEKCD